ncbi:MAG: RNA-guided endonuclease InsQ/TnpB family protein [Bifidobacterium bifidum]
MPLQQEVRRVEAAYKRFFGGEGGKPKYHGRHGSQSVEYTRGAFRNVEQAVNARWGFVTLAKLGRTRFRSSRTLPSDPSSLTVIRDPDGTWHVGFVVKEKIEPLSANNRIAAVDVGCRRLASMVTSDGSRLLFDNPKAYATRERRLARFAGETSTHDERIGQMGQMSA